MALVFGDRVVETTVTTGTGTLTLAGALSGYRAFSTVCANNDTCYYVIFAVDIAGIPSGDWESGIGTWSTGGILARSVISSSNANTLVNFAVGTKRVILAETATGRSRYPDGLVLNKASGTGIKVNTATPAYGWRDLVGAINTRASGAGVPSIAQYGTTSIYQYQFSQTTTQEVFVEFHIPHDYVPGTDVYIHAHWSQATADAGVAVKWSFDALYSKGHNQQAFPGTVTTVSVTQNSSSTVRQHMIAEVQLSTTGSIGGNALEVDGIILVRVYRDPGDAADTLTVTPFLHFVDIHYQSTNMATAGKAPDFYA